MSISRLTSKGIRSFKNLSTINFAVPDLKTSGSGLNMLVGPNNSGKSSLIETLYLANTNLTIVPSGIRNSQSENGIYIKVELTNGNTKELCSLKNNPAFINTIYLDKAGNKTFNNTPFAYIVSSKRNIGINLTSNSETWDNFLYNNGGNNYRQENLSNNIGGRFKNIIESNKDLFDYELKKILGYLPEWSLDSNDSNSLYIAFKDGNTIHENSGSGDGFINLFVILTSIYGAPLDSTIIIDEPEIALHPDVQQRLMERLVYHSQTKQIIISTHSPYFIDLNLLNAGAKLFRFYKENENTNIYSITPENISKINKLLNTIEQPYLQDIKSKEVFFLDKLILVEGPDDIYGYTSLFKKYDYNTSGNFYGWGVGGAERIETLLCILKDLNYQKVVVIFDNDKEELRNKLSKEYPDYKFLSITAKDIRDKDAPNIKKIRNLILRMKKSLDDSSCNILDDFLSKYISENEIKGIIKERSTLLIHPEYDTSIKELILSIQTYFGDSSNSEDDKLIYDRLINMNSEKIANRILEEYMQSYPEKTTRYIESKYLNETFMIGDSVCNLVNSINNVYNFEMHIMAGTTPERFVEVKINISVNINDRTVKIISYEEISNTL